EQQAAPHGPQYWQAERDPLRRWLGRVADSEAQQLALLERGSARKQRRHVRVGPDAEHGDVEQRHPIRTPCGSRFGRPQALAQLGFVAARSLVRAELAPHAMHALAREPRCALEQRFASELEVALLVLRGHAALVYEPHLDGLPALELLAQQLIRALGAAAPAQRDVSDAAIARGIA